MVYRSYILVVVSWTLGLDGVRRCGMFAQLCVPKGERVQNVKCRWCWQQTWCLSLILLVEKKLPCGEISVFPVWQLWGNWKFLQMWKNFRCFHMKYVGKSEVLHIWHVCEVENVAIYAKFMHSHVEKKWAHKYVCWEKMLNIMSGWQQFVLLPSKMHTC